MISNRIIYIVQGTTGEYSDRTDWIVKAFTTKEAAEKFQMDITNAVAEAKKHFAEGDSWFELVACANESFYEDLTYLIPYRNAILKLDHKFICDYTGTFYWVSECILEGD